MAKSKNPAELVIFGNPRRSRGRNSRKTGFSSEEKRELRRIGLRPSEFGTPEAEASARDTLKKLEDIRAKDRAGFYRKKQGNAGRDRVETVQLRTASGKPIRKVSRVHLADGRTVTFTELTSKRKAIAQARAMKNPSKPEELTQAVELFETFQGKRAENIIEAQRSAAMRTDYAALGPLLAIGLYTPNLKIPSPDHWEDYPHLKFGKDVMLASNAGASQLYAIGGDQDVSKVAAQIPDVDTSKDLLDLGPIAFVVYFARKSADNFQPTEYMHQFDTPRPSLGFDQVKREIFFAGGRYTIEERGIDH
jgi:hypothetical protein